MQRQPQNTENKYLIVGEHFKSTITVEGFYALLLGEDFYILLSLGKSHCRE